MYVSEKVKEGLRPYTGLAVQINATEVFQAENPGDGLIKQFKYLGPAPGGRQDWNSAGDFSLTSSVWTQPDGKPVATITIENTNRTAVTLYPQDLSLTLLTTRDESEIWSSSDGPSFALITRESFGSGGEPRWQGGGFIGGKSYAWTIGKENALPLNFTLGPKEKKNINVHFNLPDGQYDFLCGYGGVVHDAKAIASNLSAFDVKNGKAKEANVKRR